MADAPAVPTPAAPATPVNGKAATGTEIPTTPRGAPAKPAVQAKVPAPAGDPTGAGAGKAPAAVDPKAPPAATKPAPELFELEVDGEKVTLTREQAVRQLQKGAAGDKRLREAQEQTQKFQRALELGKANPGDLMKYLGVDAKAFAEKLLAQEAEQALMDPKDRQLLELQRENETFKQQQKANEKTQADQALAEADKKVFAQIEKSFLAAAEAGELEGTPDNLLRMIEVANEAVELGIAPTEAQIVAEVKEREDLAFSQLERKVLGGLKGEKLAKRLGPAVVEAVLTWSVEQLRGTNPYRETASAPERTEPGKPRPSFSEADYLKKHKLI